MTDLLLSELVALLLLLPVLLRPFSKSLKRGSAIPILPFLSLFVCICIIIGQGIVLSLFLLILFVLIVCLSEIIRLIAFSQGVLNDFYGIASMMLRIVLLALFCGIVYCVFTFAPESNVRTEYPLTIRPIDSYPIDSSSNPIEGLLIERQGGADKRALVIIAEALPYSGKTETLAALLADQGYTVAEITGLEPRGIIPRIELYRKLLPLIGKKEQRYLAKEDNAETAASFASFLEKTVARYGRNKRIFLYAEGIYTDLAAHFCTENPGVFTGVFFCLSEEEPLPSAPEGWAQVVREQQPDTPTEDSSASDTPAASASSSDTAASEPARQNVAEQTRALPFCFYIRPYSELAGFGPLRAEDVLAAELLGSGRSIGRQDKAAAAAAFDRYAVQF